MPTIMAGGFLRRGKDSYFIVIKKLLQLFNHITGLILYFCSAIMNHHYAIIMAGGVGTRFWPMSTTQHPKQFLDILGTGSTLLQDTYNRMLKVCKNENIYVVTNSIYFDLVKQQLPKLIKENILLEPSRRNTAPCIAYASYKIHKKDPCT